MKHEMKISTYDDSGKHISSDYSVLTNEEYQAIMNYLITGKM